MFIPNFHIFYYFDNYKKKIAKNETKRVILPKAQDLQVIREHVRQKGSKRKKELIKVKQSGY